MAEPESFSGSKIPWHPALHLVVALFHNRRSAVPREDSARRLLMLAGHPLDDVAHLAFQGLFMDADHHVQWVAAQLAMDLSLYHRPTIHKNGERDNFANDQARSQSLARALTRLTDSADTPFADVPPAWAKVSRRRRRRAETEDEDYWGEPDPLFNAQYAAEIFRHFPIEAWCQSTTYRPLLQVALTQLVAWTAERLMPSWWDRKRRREHQPRLHEWIPVFADLLARAAPYFEAERVRQRFLAPFLVDDEEALAVLAHFADKTVTRHILDAPNIPANTLELLTDCLDRVLKDRMFDPDSYRAGQVHGHDMPTMIRALLFVAVEDAPGAARFANGDWSQINLVIPSIT
ncbi:MAG: hypothetical protein J0H65_18220, partial [Rhizobiales bacterium]|nr:hypothetical protein [Hyphomicrobiales bacterium]